MISRRLRRFYSSQLSPIRGTHDIFGSEQRKRDDIIKKLYKLSELYNFEHLTTPILENEAVFKRTLGVESDVISKEMYSFVKSKETLCLRPENTAGVVRALLSNPELIKAAPMRFSYDGPMFRYERPQKGRYRQFHQFGVELFGIADEIADIEVIDMANSALLMLGIDNFSLDLNTLGTSDERKRYIPVLTEYLQSHKEGLSEISKDRLERNHPLRILDSKDPHDQAVVQGAPTLESCLSQVSKEEFEKVKQGLNTLGIKFNLNPTLVRGLDYYTKTCFEFKLLGENMAKDTVIAGGRYDGLVQLMGGPSLPAVGWACGIERLCLQLKSPVSMSKLIGLVVVETNSQIRQEGFKWASFFRRSGMKIHHLSGVKIGKLFEKMNQYKADYVLVLGETELNTHSITIKDMSNGEQSSFPLDDAVISIHNFIDRDSRGK